MTRDELAVMDGGKCILQLRGVRPFLSDKNDKTKHPSYKCTSDHQIILPLESLVMSITLDLLYGTKKPGRCQASSGFWSFSDYSAEPKMFLKKSAMAAKKFASFWPKVMALSAYSFTVS